jgi:hypothetical protein
MRSVLLTICAVVLLVGTGCETLKSRTCNAPACNDHHCSRGCGQDFRPVRHGLFDRGFLGQGCKTCGRHGGGAGGHGSCNECGAGGYHGYGQAGPAGPPTAHVAYPYYTTRGPRDFLINNPPTIGR